MILRKCVGCGAMLQEERPDEAGFIPKLLTTSEYCKRCFRLMHYNELPKIVAKNEDYENVVDSVLKRNGLIILVVDIFNFKSSFNKKIIDKIRNKDVLLVVNKFDLFPKSVNTSSIVEWLSHECEKIFFKVLAIHIVSSKKNQFIDELTNTIDLARRGRDVYILGIANVGKSSLINSLIRCNTSKTLDTITTSIIPGTTLNEIKIPFFDDNKALYDTPGLINDNDILNKLLPSSFNKIIPNSELKPITYQIYTNNAIFIAGLLSLKFINPNKISVTIYRANNLYLHRCKAERVEELYDTQISKLLTPPTEEELKDIKYNIINLKFDGKKKKTIWFSNIGFVDIRGETDLELKYIDAIEVNVTDAIIGK